MAILLLSKPFLIYHQKLSSQLTLLYLFFAKIMTNQCVNKTVYSVSLIRWRKSLYFYVLFTLTHKNYLINSMLQLYISQETRDHSAYHVLWAFYIFKPNMKWSNQRTRYFFKINFIITFKTTHSLQSALFWAKYSVSYILSATRVHVLPNLSSLDAHLNPLALEMDI